MVAQCFEAGDMSEESPACRKNWCTNKKKAEMRCFFLERKRCEYAKQLLRLKLVGPLKMLGNASPPNNAVIKNAEGG